MSGRVNLRPSLRISVHRIMRRRQAKTSRNSRARRRRARVENPFGWLSPASQNRTQTLMLHGESTLTSDSKTGDGYFVIPFDPSGSGYSFAEWSNISSLWGEIKHIATQVQFGGLYSSVITQGSPLFIGYVFTDSNVPSGLADVTQLPSAKEWNFMRDNSARGYTMTARARRPLGWSLTSTVTTSPYAGCPGAFKIAGTGYNTNTNMCMVRVKSIYLVRGRK